MKSPVTKPKKIIKKVKNKKEKRAATPNERIISAFVQQRKLERYKTEIDKRIQFLKMRNCALQVIELETQREKFNNEIISSYKGMAKKNATNVKSSDVQKPAYTGFCTIDAILNISRVIGFEDEISKHGLCNHKLRCKKCIYRSAICKMAAGKGNRTYIEMPEIRHNMDIFLARAAALQSIAVRRSTGNDIVANISAIIFFFFHFFSLFHHFHSPSRPFLIDRVLGSRNLFSKS